MVLLLPKVIGVAAAVPIATRMAWICAEGLAGVVAVAMFESADVLPASSTTLSAKQYTVEAVRLVTANVSACPAAFGAGAPVATVAPAKSNVPGQAPVV